MVSTVFQAFVRKYFWRRRPGSVEILFEFSEYLWPHVHGDVLLRSATIKNCAETGYLFEPPELQRQIGEVPVAYNVDVEIFIYFAGRSKMAASSKKCLLLRNGSENFWPDAKFLQKRTTANNLELLKNHVAHFEAPKSMRADSCLASSSDFFGQFYWERLVDHIECSIGDHWRTEN